MRNQQKQLFPEFFLKLWATLQHFTIFRQELSLYFLVIKIKYYLT